MNILYEDGDIFVVNKPPHLLSVPGRGAEKFDSVETRCAALCAGAMAVHRLDMATSGLLLIAKHKAAERHYKTLFAQRAIEKRYIAVVHGLLAADTGEITFPLIVDWDNRPRQKICYQHGKTALTRFEVVARDEKQARTRVLLFPHTGRSHQLRVHLAGIGHPIVGDEFYHDGRDNNEPRLLLHAEFLAALHRSGILQRFHLPADF